MFTTKKVRAAIIAAAVGAVLASGGVASAARPGPDINPWTTTHGQAVMADGAGAGKVTLQPFVITKKTDKASRSLF
jgi:hypothetical protein